VCVCAKFVCLYLVFFLAVRRRSRTTTSIDDETKQEKEMRKFEKK
jgi:hypothetical protein